MPRENDQTRWVGIRPTTNCGAVPVAEDHPLTDILVAPSAGNPQFQTRTRKFEPAISDLQAIKDDYNQHLEGVNKDCRVEYQRQATAVPAGEIWVINNVFMFNETSLCDHTVLAVLSGWWHFLKVAQSVAPFHGLLWQGQIVLAEDDFMVGRFSFGGATDDVNFSFYGYKIGVY